MVCILTWAVKIAFSSKTSWLHFKQLDVFQKWIQLFIISVTTFFYRQEKLMRRRTKGSDMYSLCSDICSAKEAQNVDWCSLFVFGCALKWNTFGVVTALCVSFACRLPQVWDFNGRCLHRMNAGLGQAVEISQVLLLKRSILVMSWERYCGWVYLRVNVMCCLLTICILCFIHLNVEFNTKCATLKNWKKTQVNIRCFDAVTPS